MFRKGSRFKKGLRGSPQAPARVKGPSDYRVRAAGGSMSTPRRDSAPLEDRVDRLDDAVGDLSPYLRERFISPVVMVNPLLLVWDAAHAVSPDVATPVEALLTALLHRSTVASMEVLNALQEVRALALQELVLETCAIRG